MKSRISKKQFFHFCTALLLFFYACKEDNQTKTDKDSDVETILQLEEKFGSSDFMLPAEILFPMEAIPQFKGVPDQFENYVFRNYIFSKDQHLYLQFVRGEVDLKEYEILKTVYQIDESKLVNTSIETEIHVLIGDLKNGKRGVVFDTNFDYDFSNEKIIAFDYPMIFIDEEDEAFFNENKLKFLPQVTLRLPFPKKGEINYDEVNVSINPYKPFDRFFISKDPRENDFYLELLFPTYYESEVVLSEKKYRFQFGPKNNLAQLSAQNLTLLISEVVQENEADINYTSLLRIQPNDTFNIAWGDYVVDLSNFDTKKQISTIFLGENKTPFGGSVGYYTKLPEATPLLKNPSNEDVSLAENPSHTLYFAWTTWNLASLQEVPSLKEFQKEFPTVQIIGVCVDDTQGVAERMQFRRGMQWKSFFIETKKENNWASQMQIESFPTYILVNENNQIKARSHHLNMVRKYLANNSK